WRSLNQQFLESLEDERCLRPMRPGSHAELDLGWVDVENLEEAVAQRPVIVLTGVDRDEPEPAQPLQGLRDRCQLDEVRAGTGDQVHGGGSHRYSAIVSPTDRPRASTRRFAGSRPRGARYFGVPGPA